MVGPGTSRSSTPRTEATVGSDALLDCSGFTVKVPPGKGGWTVSRENSGPSLPPGLSGPQLSHRAAALPASSHHPGSSTSGDNGRAGLRCRTCRRGLVDAVMAHAVMAHAVVGLGVAAGTCKGL